MDELDITRIERVFRCGLPGGSLKGWLARQGQENLRIATYGVSAYNRLGDYLPREVPLQLLVGISGIDPFLIRDLHNAPERERWQRLLKRMGLSEQNHLLRTLGRLAGWEHAGAEVRVSPPGALCGLMHLKIYLGKSAALVGSANFTVQGIEGTDQQELLFEVGGPSLIPFRAWWETAWAGAWPVASSIKSPKPLNVEQGDESSVGNPKDNEMCLGAKILLGHWLGEWGAWALNGNGVVAYPHQLQAVEWIRPDGRAYLFNDPTRS